jgi:cyclic beta-1,2-glucan synthetase
MSDKAPDQQSIPSSPAERPAQPVEIHAARDPEKQAGKAAPVNAALAEHARAVSISWDVAHTPTGPDSFSRRLGAVSSTYDRVYDELDRRPMPTYKPGEPLDPLLELRENPRLLRSVLVEMGSIRKRLARLPRVVRAREGDEPRIITVADTYLQASGSHWEGTAVSLRELWAFPTAVKFLLVEEILTQAQAVIDNPAAHDATGAALLKTRFQSIRDATYANWPQMIEGLVVFDALLRRDPAGAYAEMDFESRENYRERVAEISRYSDCSEMEAAGPCRLLPARQRASGAGQDRQLPAAIDRSHPDGAGAQSR